MEAILISYKEQKISFFRSKLQKGKGKVSHSKNTPSILTDEGTIEIIIFLPLLFFIVFSFFSIYLKLEKKQIQSIKKFQIEWSQMEKKYGK